MTSSTDTRPGETGALEAPSPPQGRPRSRARRAVLTWAAIVAPCVAAAALAAAVLTDGGDATDFPATRLAPQAEQVDREAHLEGQARTYGDADTDFPVTRLTPRAEQVDREAHLEGQARTYGDADTANDRQSGGPSTDDFVPGSRRMPTR